MSPVLLAAGLVGCLPAGSNWQEEQKEPHYLAGKARVRSLDFEGAVEAYKKALEVNPRSASAHFELGWLYEERVRNPAAAIYHYEEYLRLRPQADNAEMVRQRITTCKQELARAVLPLPVTPSLQREFEQLAEENRRLREELARWQAHAASLGRSATNPAAPVVVMQRADAVSAVATQRQATATVPAPSSTVAPPPAPRTHTVQPGETPYTIARKHGVKLDALMAANPGINPKRLAVGQKLNIPGQ